MFDPIMHRTRAANPSFLDPANTDLLVVPSGLMMFVADAGDQVQAIKITALVFALVSFVAASGRCRCA